MGLDTAAFGLIVAGDDILCGMRQDRRFAKVAAMLAERGLRLTAALSRIANPDFAPPEDGRIPVRGEPDTQALRTHRRLPDRAPSMRAERARIGLRPMVCRVACRPNNSAVVFLRKNSTRIKFVKPCLACVVLMWWNITYGRCHLEWDRTRRMSELMATPITRTDQQQLMASGLTGIARKVASELNQTG